MTAPPPWPDDEDQPRSWLVPWVYPILIPGVATLVAILFLLIKPS